MNLAWDAILDLGCLSLIIATSVAVSLGWPLGPLLWRTAMCLPEWWAGRVHMGDQLIIAITLCTIAALMVRGAGCLRVGMGVALCSISTRQSSRGAGVRAACGSACMRA